MEERQKKINHINNMIGKTQKGDGNNIWIGKFVG